MRMLGFRAESWSAVYSVQAPRMDHGTQNAGFRVSQVTGAGPTVPARAWLNIGYNL